MTVGRLRQVLETQDENAEVYLMAYEIKSQPYGALFVGHWGNYDRVKKALGLGTLTWTELARFFVEKPPVSQKTVFEEVL